MIYNIPTNSENRNCMEAEPSHLDWNFESVEFIQVTFGKIWIPLKTPTRDDEVFYYYYG